MCPSIIKGAFVATTFCLCGNNIGESFSHGPRAADTATKNCVLTQTMLCPVGIVETLLRDEMNRFHQAVTCSITGTKSQCTIQVLLFMFISGERPTMTESRIETSSLSYEGRDKTAFKPVIKRYASEMVVLGNFWGKLCKL